MLNIPEIPELQAGHLPEAARLLRNLEAQPIACNNWPEAYPDRPEASFRMATDGKENLFIHFTVDEDATLAAVNEDNGPVWTDSCVEFFLSLDGSGYYNFEFTCIGRLLIGFRKERPAAVHASPEILASVRRFPSLGTAVFPEKKLGHPWELTAAIPCTALFRHRIGSWKGLAAKANLYKCGDNLSRPHYLSWQPIHTEKPDFHRPESFAGLVF